MSYRVINVFKLKPGAADQEIERCHDRESMLNRLKVEPGFISYEVVKLSEDSIATIQAWVSAAMFGRAIAKVSAAHANSAGGRESLAVSREGFSGNVVLEG